jgi:hypothetical protein
MRNLRRRPRLCRASPREGSARGNSAGNARVLGQGITPVTPVDNKNPDEKIVPAREHSRLTSRKSTDGRARRTFAAVNAHMDGQRMKENKDAL